MTLSDLIERLEQATEGSRELSHATCKAAGWREKNGCWSPPGLDAFQWVSTPDVTRSIDAALTLVPEGWVPHMHFADPMQKTDSHDCILGWPGTKEVGAYGKTMPIAIVIAALKAIEGKP